MNKKTIEEKARDDFLLRRFFLHSFNMMKPKKERKMIRTLCAENGILTIYVWILSVEFIIFMGVGRQDVMPDDKNI